MEESFLVFVATSTSVFLERFFGVLLYTLMHGNICAKKGNAAKRLWKRFLWLRPIPQRIAPGQNLSQPGELERMY